VQRPVSLRLVAFLCVTFLATLGALVLADANPVIVLAPVLLILVYLGLVRLPLRVSACLLLTAVLSADYIAERPFDGLWESPLFPLGRMLFVNLNHLTPLAFLRFPPLDFMVLFLAGVAVYRKANGIDIDKSHAPSARVMHVALALSFFSILLVEVWGVARGGNFKESLWQFHQMGFIPLITFVFLSALRGPGDHALIAKIIVGAACLKTALGAFFIYTIARPGGHVVEFATSHSDSFIYVTAMVIGVVMFIEQPTRKNLFWASLFVPWVTFGMVINDRRLAYVSLGAIMFMVYMFSRRTRLKVLFTRTAILLMPLIVLYIATGWEQSGVAFLPVQTFKSVLFGESEYKGPDYRDMEDFNLMMTWNRNPVLGSGFGHKFEEPIKMPDISFAMPNYQYQPHNTVLWMWGVAGVFGFTGIFMYLSVGVFLAARSYRLAKAPRDRMVALVAISVIIQYWMQCYGDMGTNSWIGAFLMGVSLALVGRLAVRVGAWPASRAAPRPDALTAPSAVPSLEPAVLLPLPQSTQVQG
jgi:hypothetical protein